MLTKDEAIWQVNIARTALAETSLNRIVPHISNGRSDQYGVTLWGAHSDDGTWETGHGCDCFQKGIFPLHPTLEIPLFYRAFFLARSVATLTNSYEEFVEKRLFKWIWPSAGDERLDN